MKGNTDISGGIFGVIKTICMMNEKTMSAELNTIEKRVIAKGYS